MVILNDLSYYIGNTGILVNIFFLRGIIFLHFYKALTFVEKGNKFEKKDAKYKMNIFQIKNKNLKIFRH